ncbi:FmdB family zinc ribbon protein [Pollutimonas harenae]|uniref:Zinc ribbon domain-containing protein n=1 Tax=Pollutimonas harenae TaxID=657015 RepID=A0A853GX74_9BURK|nr:FmdB family zinc ribbon protein [Pollutimonas harenae]NYT84732.1 zinc ribbon domain-containing protein [Pollutimonas harenae]TEA72866.1 zinc ribbon domain-containing protein [Pollutimonas harenae]
MPIYAYKCSACGHAQDVLQKMSDPVLTVCPECNASAYEKQVTAAGFQLKGSGWYVTDFRNGGGASKSAAPAAGGGASGTASDTGNKASAATPAAPAAGSAPAT